MKIEQDLLKKIILEQVQEKLEELEQESIDVTSKMTPGEQNIDSLISSLVQMEPKFQKILDLIRRAKKIPNQAKREEILSQLDKHFVEISQFADSIGNTIQLGDSGSTMEEQEILSLMQEKLEEALTDYDPQQRNKIRDIAIEIVRKVTEDPRWEDKANERPSNSVEMIWDMATSIHKQKEEMVSKQVSEFLDSIGADAPEEMASDLERGLYQETFKIKKSRLQQIIAEEMASAKKQGLL